MIPQESLKRDFARLIIWYPFRLLVRALPLSWSIALFRLLGMLHFFAARKRCDKLLKNMDFLKLEEYDDQTLRKAVMEYYQNHYVDRLHIFLYPALRKKKERIRRLMGSQGIRHIREALNAGKGVIVVHGHFGPIQLPLFLMHERGFEVMQIGLPSDKGLSAVGKKVAYKLRLKYENMLPASIHSADSYMRPIFRHLKKGGIVFTTGDGAGRGEIKGKTRTLPFLDGAMRFPEGPVKLARMTGALLIPAFIIKDRNDFYKFIVGRPLSVNYDHRHPTEPDYVPVEEDMKSFAVQLERFIKRYPGHWHFWDEWAPGKRKINLNS